MLRMGAATLVSAFVFVIFLVHLWVTHSSDAHASEAIQYLLKDSGFQSSDGGSKRQKPQGYDEQIRNETLGFERVFVLNLPQRGDRLDAFTVAASLTGFKAETMPGIDGTTVPNSAIPSTEGLDSRERNAVVGTWRAHLNIARKIVQERISSAFIFEDDSDWDVSLKDRLVDFAHGTRHFSEYTLQNPSESPYGDDWDFLWPGHCGASLQVDSSPNGPPQGWARQRFLVQNDGTTIKKDRRRNYHWIPDMSAIPDTTRIIFKANFGVCLYGYALSYRGAQKVLHALGQRKSWAPVDFGIGEMCQDSKNPFNCVSIFPQIIETHKMAGNELRDSNINSHLKDKIRPNGYTFNVIKSVRLNAARLLKGEEAVSQWPDEPLPVVEPGGITYKVVDVDNDLREANGNADPQNP